MRKAAAPPPAKNAKKRDRARFGPIVGGLGRRHKAGCAATEPVNGCACPIVVSASIKGRGIKKSLGTTDWLEGQRLLRDMIDEAAAHAAADTAWVQRGLARSLVSHGAGAETVKIPRTSARASQRIFAKLLTRVDPDGEAGFGFEGTVVKPGDMLPLSALWPTPAHPKIPILLECAGAVNPKSGHGRQDQENRYILWRFHEGRHEFQEIARSASSSWTWAMDLRPIAIRALEESRGKDVAVYVGLDQFIARMGAALDQEIKQVAPPERKRAMAALHDQWHFRYVSYVLGTLKSADTAAQAFVELAPADALPAG
jgi:hypothetical protein